MKYFRERIRLRSHAAVRLRLAFSIASFIVTETDEYLFSSVLFTTVSNSPPKVPFPSVESLKTQIIHLDREAESSCVTCMLQ